MARAILVSVTKRDGNQRVLGIYTQAKKAWEAIKTQKYPGLSEIRVQGQRPLLLAYNAMVARLRSNGKLVIWMGKEHLAFVIQVELNETYTGDE